MCRERLRLLTEGLLSITVQCVCVFVLILIIYKQCPARLWFGSTSKTKSTFDIYFIVHTIHVEI